MSLTSLLSTTTGQVASSVLISMAVAAAIVEVTHQSLRRMRGHPEEASFRRAALVPLLLLVGIIAFSQSWPGGLKKLGQNMTTGAALAEIGLVAVTVWRIVHYVFCWIRGVFDISAENNLRNRRIRTQLQFVEKLTSILLVVLSMAAVLVTFEWGHKFGEGLLASAGVASLVIGFAAQKSLGNLLAGFQIAFTQPIRLDDALVVENEWGWVEEITLTYVVVRLWDRRRLVLPIQYFVEKPFQNWTRNSAQILGAVHLRVGFNVPVEAVEKEFFRLLDTTDLWDGDAKVLQVVEAHERSVEVRCLMTAKNSPTAFDLRCYVRRGLIEYLQTHFPEALPVISIRSDEVVPFRPSGTGEKAEVTAA